MKGTRRGLTTLAFFFASPSFDSPKEAKPTSILETEAKRPYYIYTKNNLVTANTIQTAVGSNNSS